MVERLLAESHKWLALLDFLVLLFENRMSATRLRFIVFTIKRRYFGGRYTDV
jgi:hypothetical protein